MRISLIGPSVLVSLLLVAGPLALPAWSQPGGNGPPPAQVELDQVRVETVQEQREVTGELRSLRRSTLAAAAEGLVIELNVDDGDSVERGDVVARLDDRLARLAVSSAEKEIRSLEAVIAERRAELERAERDLGRFEELAARDSASRQEVEDARTTEQTIRARLARAEADRSTAEVALRDAEQRLADKAIIAPFAGRVTARRTEVGEWVSRGGAIAEIIALETIEARLEVPERFSEAFRESTVEVTVRVMGVRVESETQPGVLVPLELRARVDRVIPDVDRMSRLFPVRVLLSNDDERLSPGMSITGFVPTGVEREVMTISRDAVLRDDAGEFVYMDRDGVAAPMRIRTRYAVGDRVVIQRGILPEGSRVVVRGNERLFPGQPLMVVGGN